MDALNCTRNDTLEWGQSKGSTLTCTLKCALGTHKGAPSWGHTNGQSTPPSIMRSRCKWDGWWEQHQVFVVRIVTTQHAHGHLHIPKLSRLQSRKMCKDIANCFYVTWKTKLLHNKEDATWVDDCHIQTSLFDCLVVGWFVWLVACFVVD